MADSKEPAHDNDKLGAVHHYVPQGYLKRFTLIDKPEQIYAYEIGKEPYPTNVHNIAGQRDFYTYTKYQIRVKHSLILTQARSSLAKLAVKQKPQEGY